MRAFYYLAAASFVMAAPASASEVRPFDSAKFQALQARNAPSVIFVHADWCPICRAQDVTIKKLLATPKYKDVTVLIIDYDTQKALWTKFGVTKQSTLIGFHGRRETGRIAYDASPDKVTSVVDSSLR